MSYGLIKYVQHIDKYNVTHRIEIHKKGYSGASVRMNGVDDVFKFDQEIADPKEGKYLCNALLELNVAVENSTDVAFLTSIFESDEDEFKIIWKRNNIVFWTGYVLNDLLTIEESSFPYFANIVAKDLSRLKGVDYEFQDERKTIIKVVSELLDYLNLGININTYTSWIEENSITSLDFLRQNYIDTYALRSYRRNGDEEDETITVYEALDILSSNFGLVIKQIGNTWKVEQITSYKNPSSVKQVIYDNDGEVLSPESNINTVQDAVTDSVIVKSLGSLTEGVTSIKRAIVNFAHRVLLTDLQIPDLVYLAPSDASPEPFTMPFVSDGDQTVIVDAFISALTFSTEKTVPLYFYVLQAGGYYWDDEVKVWFKPNTPEAPIKTNFLPSSVNTTNNTINLGSSSLITDADVVRVNTTDTLPDGLDTETEYFLMKAPTPFEYYLSKEPDGAIVDLQSVGIGTHTLTRVNNRRVFTVVNVDATYNTVNYSKDLSYETAPIPLDASGTFSFRIMKSTYFSGGNLVYFEATSWYKTLVQIFNPSNQSGTSIEYHLTQDAGFSTIATLPDTWYGNAVEVFARSAIRYSTDLSDVTTGWAKRGEVVYGNFHQVRLKELLDVFRAWRRHLTANIHGAYDPFKVLAYRGKNYLYLGGMFNGREGDWEAQTLEINIQSGVDEFEEFKKVDKSRSSGTVIIGGGGSGTALDVYSKIESDNKYLGKANNLSDLVDASTARTNLGLGSGDSPVFSGATLGDLSFSGHTISSSTDLILDAVGDIYINGETIQVDKEMTTTDNIVVLNAGETGSGITAGSAGLQFDRGSAVDYQILFQESNQLFSIGKVGNLQAVATRDDVMAVGGIPYWDSANKFINNSLLTYSNGLLKSPNAQFSSLNSNGGIVYTDSAGKLHNTANATLDGDGNAGFNGHLKANGGKDVFYDRGHFTNNADANTITTTGIYLNTTGNGTGSVNFPSTYGILNHYESSYYASQLHLRNGGLFFRQRTTTKNDDWTNWYDIYNSGKDVVSTYSAQFDSGYKVGSTTVINSSRNFFANKLSVASTSTFSALNKNGGIVYTDASGKLQNSANATLDGNGNAVVNSLGIGTTGHGFDSDGRMSANQSNIRIYVNTGSTGETRTKPYEALRLEATNNAGFPPYHGFGPALDFWSRNYDGPTIRPNARISGSIYNSSTKDDGGRLRFFTTPTDTAINEDDFVEQMILDSDGSLNLLNGNYKIGSQTVINSSRNFFANKLSVASTSTFSGVATFNENVTLGKQATTISHPVRADRTITFNTSTEGVLTWDSNAQNLTGNRTWTPSLRDATATLRGVVSAGAQTFGGVKIFSNNVLFNDGFSSVGFTETSGIIDKFDMGSDGFFRTSKIQANELRVKSFTAEISAALYGEDILTKSRGVLSRDFVVPNYGADAQLYVEDLEGLPNTDVFEVGDWIRLRVVNRDSGLEVTDVWGKVYKYASPPSTEANEQVWKFTREPLATGGSGSQGAIIYTGSIAIDYGVSGDGVMIRSVLGNFSPKSDILTWTINPTDANNYTLLIRSGNLKDINANYGYGIWTDNAYLTGNLIVGDLTETNNFLKFDGSLHIDAENFNLRAGDDFWKTSDNSFQFGGGNGFKKTGSTISMGAANKGFTLDGAGKIVFGNDVTLSWNQVTDVNIGVDWLTDAGAFAKLDQINGTNVSTYIANNAIKTDQLLVNTAMANALFAVDATISKKLTLGTGGSFVSDAVTFDKTSFKLEVVNLLIDSDTKKITLGTVFEANGNSNTGKLSSMLFDTNKMYIGDGTFAHANTKVYLGSAGISLTDKFSVTNAGLLTASSGKVAVWDMNSNNLNVASLGIYLGKIAESDTNYHNGFYGLSLAGTEVVQYGNNNYWANVLGFGGGGLYKDDRIELKAGSDSSYIFLRAWESGSSNTDELKLITDGLEIDNTSDFIKYATKFGTVNDTSTVLIAPGDSDPNFRNTTGTLSSLEPVMRFKISTQHYNPYGVNNVSVEFIIEGYEPVSGTWINVYVTFAEGAVVGENSIWTTNSDCSISIIDVGNSTAGYRKVKVTATRPQGSTTTTDTYLYFSNPSDSQYYLNRSITKLRLKVVADTSTQDRTNIVSSSFSMYQQKVAINKKGLTIATDDYSYMTVGVQGLSRNSNRSLAQV